MAERDCVPCARCGGSGRIREYSHNYQGTCFNCKGSGCEPGQKAYKPSRQPSDERQIQELLGRARGIYSEVRANPQAYFVRVWEKERATGSLVARQYAYAKDVNGQVRFGKEMTEHVVQAMISRLRKVFAAHEEANKVEAGFEALGLKVKRK